MAAATSSGFDLLGGPDISGPFSDIVDVILSFASDFFAFIVIAALVAAYAFYFGRDRLMTLIAGLYAAIPLYQSFPYFSAFPDNPYVHMGVYAAFALAGLIAFSGLSAFLARSSSSFFGTGILSLLSAGLVLAIAVHVIPVEEVYAFSDPTLALFSSEQALFFWLLAPLGGLFFFGK